MSLEIRFDDDAQKALGTLSTQEILRLLDYLRVIAGPIDADGSRSSGAVVLYDFLLTYSVDRARQRLCVNGLRRVELGGERSGVAACEERLVAELARRR